MSLIVQKSILSASVKRRLPETSLSRTWCRPWINRRLHHVTPKWVDRTRERDRERNVIQAWGAGPTIGHLPRFPGQGTNRCVCWTSYSHSHERWVTRDASHCHWPLSSQLGPTCLPRLLCLPIQLQTHHNFRGFGLQVGGFMDRDKAFQP